MVQLRHLRLSLRHPDAGFCAHEQAGNRMGGGGGHFDPALVSSRPGMAGGTPIVELSGGT
jgi:hypothetical protein